MAERLAEGRARRRPPATAPPAATTDGSGEIGRATSQPRVKPEHRPYRLPDGRVRLGGAESRLAADAVDPAGRLWPRLGLLDGTRTQGQVADLLSDAFPGLTRADVADMVDELARSGHLRTPAPGRSTT